jgi:hypothetical protein
MEGSGGVVAGNRPGLLASTVPSRGYRRLRGKGLNAGAPQLQPQLSAREESHLSRTAGGRTVRGRETPI